MKNKQSKQVKKKELNQNNNLNKHINGFLFSIQQIANLNEHLKFKMIIKIFLFFSLFNLLEFFVCLSKLKNKTSKTTSAL